MSWDITVLKKYNNTSHYRLLNQLKNEFKTVKQSQAEDNNSLNIDKSPLNHSPDRLV